MWALAATAHAADTQTINHTGAYVDPAIAAEFVTVPTLCTEPIGSAGTSITACSELGSRAVQAIQGTSLDGDVYWEPSNLILFHTQAFVPHNANTVSYGEFSGFSPIFSQHKYDLFGSGSDLMGPFTREENLLLNIAFPTNGAVPQTDPGEGSVGPITVGYARTIILAVLEEPDGDMIVNFGGLDFAVDHLPTFERVTGITDGGKADTIWAHCHAQYPPPLDDTLCGPDPSTPGVLPFSTQADLWMVDTYIGQPGGLDVLADYFPDPCGAADGSSTISNCLLHEQWIDQVVAGYVEAWESVGGDGHFAQNFRSQVGFDNTVVLNAATGRIVDQRLEQSAELSGAFTSEGGDPGDSFTPGDNLDGIAGRQTFQQAFQGFGGQDLGGNGQMVSQDVQGYFMSCFNCETPAVSHAFEPAKQDLVYMPYESGWNIVPTITHGGS